MADIMKQALLAALKKGKNSMIEQILKQSLDSEEHDQIPKVEGHSGYVEGNVDQEHPDEAQDIELIDRMMDKDKFGDDGHLAGGEEEEEEEEIPLMSSLGPKGKPKAIVAEAVMIRDDKKKKPMKMG